VTARASPPENTDPVRRTPSGAGPSDRAPTALAAVSGSTVAASYANNSLPSETCWWGSSRSFKSIVRSGAA
jgi:hypothetical protein